MSDLHDVVNVPKLLFLGGLVETIAEGQRAIAHGNVYIQRWNIGISHVNLPRWVLRGVTIRIGDRSMTISDDGFGIRRTQKAARTLEHC